MRWTPGHRSENVEDRRGERVPGGGIGVGGIFSLFRLASLFGWPGIVVAGLGLVGYFALTSTSQVADVEVAPDGQVDDASAFVGSVLDDVQLTWQEKLGARYQPTKLVLFTNRTVTGCGMGAAAVGPFYCPEDQKVYIDLSFYAELSRRFGAPGDFAQAYVIAHEVGHHVQHLMGWDAGSRREGAQGGSVRLELQADCLAGVWAKATDKRGMLEPGDLEEAVTAAGAIGDDKLQADQGAVRPDSFTHGTAAQRARWLQRGYQAGDPGACDTSGEL